MNAVTVIFPHQLFADNPALDRSRPVYLVELTYFFTRYLFHKHKLILHYASMQAYSAKLKKMGYKVNYLDHQKIPTISKLIDYLQIKNTSQIHYCELIEHQLNDDLLEATSKKGYQLFEYISPYFISDRSLLKKFFKPKKKQYLMAAFYRQQRISLNILITQSKKPLGGKWSFDELNREKLPNNLTVSKPTKARSNAYCKKAITLVDKKFKKNPGSSKAFYYPTTHAQAQKWLDQFLQERFKLFGPYQDAIDKNNSILFHSVLTPMLNVGLLTPKQVVNSCLAYAKKHTIPINSLEGFIRQVIGWREFVYGMYHYHGKKQLSYNYFKHTRSIPHSFWSGTIGLEPVDITIQNVLENAYAHHIERLMILGNFMLLCQFNPNQVYDWFMELFIDAYDWVMVPNVYGMSQYADGGLLATKPYISGSNYILKMSNYTKGTWCEIWDGLFWNFIDTHLKTFSTNPRCAFMVASWKRMDMQKRREHIACARLFLNSL